MSKIVEDLGNGFGRCLKVFEQIESLDKLYLESLMPGEVVANIFGSSEKGNTQIAGTVDTLLRMLKNEVHSLSMIFEKAQDEGKIPYPYLHEKGITASEAFEDWKSGK